MNDRDILKTNAAKLDDLLRTAVYKTLLHGDPKPDNFCFGKQDQVAAVDFQYSGWGVGVVDLAYLLGEFSGMSNLEKYETELLNEYFQAL